ncbi:MAG: DUF2802 domain-containing protein [Acidobacteriia bacterium]|nr:DUF2802 domain-containing protein [Terriglobia bacterium]
MDSTVLPLAVICSFGLAGVGLSFLALFQAKSVAGILERRTQARHARLEAAFVTARAGMEGLEAEIREIQQQPPVSFLPAPPKPGLNICKRSQALRMHRHGSTPAQIAATLEVPLQEIDLLLKVHRIVLNNLVVTARSESTVLSRAG